MKRISFIIFALLLCTGFAHACSKRNLPSSETRTRPLTVIVMDTTQALLPGAVVRVGKSVYTTSFDGRVELSPEHLAGVRSVKVTCKGYKSSAMRIKDEQTMEVRLVPNAGKPAGSKGGDKLYLTMGMRRGASAETVYKDVAMAEHDGIAETAMAGVYHGAPVGNNVSAGKLTAGEVNDFARWSSWSTIIDSTHARFTRTWGIEPRERYTVAVTDKHGYPVVNYPVSLTDERGNTIFQAMTDNTGKAELWNSLLLNSQPRQVNEPLKHIVVDEPCEIAEGADVLFVFDATGSMGDELHYLQAEMKDVIARASEATGGLKIRTGAVVYRDHGDEYLTRLSRLTEDIATTQSFIDRQEANGGGDYPEAIPEALMAALNSAGWNEEARARIAFLILDAPCHEDSATLALLDDQILNAAAAGVRIVPVICSGIEESGEYLLRSIALATNGTSFFLTDDSGVGYSHLNPTTDSLRVEHLNDMLVRTIVEFCYMPDCTGHWHDDEIANVQEDFIPNPFDATDLISAPSIPHGPNILYLLDVSGKLITVYNGRLEDAGDAQLSRLTLQLPTGIYFVKAFYDGQWHTKKILVH